VRLTDLLDADVVAPSGRTIGHVHDVRLVQDGPPIGNAGASFRVEGLVVGGTSVGSRLGFTRSEVRGPWLLERLVRRLHADERLVPWTSVRAVTPDAVHVEVEAADLPPPHPTA
jgi:sporulation protein YlmC with PRC-barrel domain